MRPNPIDIEVAGDRLANATTQLMAMLKVERICEDERDKASEDSVPDFELALECAHERTKNAWRNCISALSQWESLRRRWESQ